MHACEGLLTREQEADLAARRDAGDQTARNELVERSLGLVPFVVKSFHQKRDNADEMVAVGNVALVIAANNYRPSEHEGLKFSTYAGHCIRKQLINEYFGRDLVRIPYYMRGKVMAYLRSSRPADRPPSELTALAYRAHGAHQRLSSGDGSTANSPELADGKADVYAATAEGIDAMAPRLALLTSLQFLVIVRRYGLDRNPPMTQKAIGLELGYTREWVQKVEHKALMIMRAAEIIAPAPATTSSPNE